MYLQLWSLGLLWGSVWLSGPLLPPHSLSEHKPAAAPARTDAPSPVHTNQTNDVHWREISDGHCLTHTHLLSRAGDEALMQSECLFLGETLSLVVPKQSTLDLSHTHKEKGEREECRWQVFTQLCVQETQDEFICMVIRRQKKQFWSQQKEKNVLILFLVAAWGNEGFLKDLRLWRQRRHANCLLWL